MRQWLLTAAIVGLGSVIAVPDVEARRLGGGRSVGAQRSLTAPPAQTPAKPVGQQGTQQAAQGQQGVQPAAAPAGSRWAPILGGLAVGGILGYLFGGGGPMGLLLLALLAMAAVFVVRALMQRRAGEARPLQFAGMREAVPVAMGSGLPEKTTTGHVPAGFDAAGFLRAAKMNFLKLQAANDAGRLEEIREFTTEELYEALKGEAGARGETEVIGLEAELLELATEGERHWASVRFSGAAREAPGAAPEAFAEIWNLVKPADGSSGWLLAGIQQMH